MNRTKIEWVKNPDGSQGYTWNPITGCLNGCSYCYARNLANSRLKQVYSRNPHVAILDSEVESNEQYDRKRMDPFYPRFWGERLKQPYEIPPCDARRKYKGIFVCDMGELFGGWVPLKWQEQVFEVIRDNPWHRFYLLTKQPQNLAKWSPFPDNCWVGATATDTECFLQVLSHLESIRAKVKFISVEPLCGWNFNFTQAYLVNSIKRAKLGWLIIGQQTPISKATEPSIEWLQEIVDAADKAGVKVFLKDNLKPLIFKDAISSQAALDLGLLNWAGELRQEIPCDKKGGER